MKCLKGSMLRLQQEHARDGEEGRQRTQVSSKNRATLDDGSGVAAIQSLRSTAARQPCLPPASAQLQLTGCTARLCCAVCLALAACMHRAY